MLIDSCVLTYRKVSVHFGGHDICEEDWVSTQLVRPSRFKIHPGYNPKTDDNDVAILLLKRDIHFGPKVDYFSTMNTNNFQRRVSRSRCTLLINYFIH